MPGLSSLPPFYAVQDTDRTVGPGALLAHGVEWVSPLHLVQRRLFGESRCCQADTTNPHTSICISEEASRGAFAGKKGKSKMRSVLLVDLILFREWQDHAILSAPCLLDIQIRV